MEPKPHQSFYADISAALMARIPVELESRSLLQSVVTPTTSQIRNAAEAEHLNATAIASRHQAALDIHGQLGSMVPVLDGLSTRAIASQKFAAMFRRVLWYVALLLLVALLGLLYFKRYIAPEYELVRQDIQLHYGITEFSGNMFPYIIPLIAVVAILLFLTSLFLLTNWTGWLINLFGGREYVRSILLFLTSLFLLTNWTGWLINLFGGREYVRLKVLSGAAKTLALLASQGTTLTDATETTATLYALDIKGRNQLSGSIGDASSVETWQNLSQFWSIKAAKTLKRARTLAPVVLLLTIGGGVAVAYALLVYGPLIGLIRDLVEAGLRS